MARSSRKRIWRLSGLRGRRKWLLPLFFLLLLLTSGGLTAALRFQAAVGYLPENVLASAEFRSLRISQENWQRLQERSAQEEEGFGEELAAAMVAGRFDLSGQSLPSPESCRRVKELLTYYRSRDYRQLAAAYQALFAGEQVFPVPDRQQDPDRRQTGYENSWMAPRNYGGSRNHEGTDIFGAESLPGYYPVLSITEGTVEKLGWLPLGGYRVGVRSDSGVYYYYAHLDSYAEGLRAGDRVQAGELLGFLGDTGYGEEGTRGKFVPHLHLGIYLRTQEEPELAVNPYYVLGILEQNIRRYRY